MLLALVTAMPCAPNEPAPGLGGTIGIGSDHAFRSVSQTSGQPATRALLDLGFSSGYYACAWISNVDFSSFDTVDDGAEQEVAL